MKALFIVTDLSGGGAEKAILNTADALKSRGHEIHLALLQNKCVYSTPENLPLHILTNRLHKGYLNKLLLARKLKKLHKILVDHSKFDLIVSTLPFCDEIVHMAGISNCWHRIADSLSVEIDKLKVENPSKALRRAKRYRKIYSGSNIIAVSDGVKEDLIHRSGIKPKRTEVIHNLYDFERIRKQGCESNPKIPESPYLIHVGRFAPQKRHDLLLEAFSKMKSKHKLVLLTESSLELQALIELYGVSEKVVIAGFQKNPYIWIKQAELLILCSDHEGLPNVLIEAIILGTPVVSTDCPSGPKEILGNLAENYLVERNNPHALYQSIEYALQKEFQQPEGFSEKYSKEQSLGKYEKLFI